MTRVSSINGVRTTLIEGSPSVAFEEKSTTNQCEQLSSLSVFTFLWSQVAALQLGKLWTESRMLPFSVLSIAIVLALIYPRSSSTFALLVIESFILFCYGSLSNHVIVSIFVCFTVLVSYSKDRAIWAARTTGNVRLLVGALYLITGLHKLNADWFNPRYSCANLMIAGSFAVVRVIPDWVTTAILPYVPVFAVGVELVLGLLWLLPSHLMIRRLAAILGAGMHIMLAFPLSPMSVYPFSVLMVPLYVFLVPEDVVSGVRWILERKRGALAAFGLLFGTCIMNLEHWIGLREPMYEYPAYSSWPLAVTWNSIAWVLMLVMVLVGLIGRVSFCRDHADSDASPRTNTKLQRTPLGYFFAVSLFVFGFLPYLGLRTYPALAMFSNLRTEGRNQNHFFLPRSLDVFGYQRDTVKILDSDSARFRNFQVDLGELFHDGTQSYLDKFNISNEFFIVPPSWRDTSPGFRPFEVPVIEFRRRASQARGSQDQQFQVLLEYRGERVAYDSSIGDDRFDDMLNLVEETVLRFRTFDSDYSPCRH